MNEIEEIKNRIDIVELAKEYMTLRNAGRNYKALCPLHSEKTPSLMVTPDKQIWHCFGCGEGGDIFTLVQKMENVDFYEALKSLAEKAGVELKKTPGFKEYKKKVAKLQDINELAAEFYHQSYWLSKSGQIARDYVGRRGLDENTIKKFKLGYAPNIWDALVKFLQKRGFQDKQIVEAGLGSYSKKGGVVDRFRQRLMFPIWNLQGKIVGFTGRVLDEKDSPKYLNTPATKVFDKGKIWYGWHLAKGEIREAGKVIVCEGQMDVISCHQFGYTNTICSSGTAITGYQLNYLRRITENVLLAFDNDEAGRRSGYRATGLALASGLTVKIIDLGEYKDPDELVRRDLEEWRKRVDEARSFVEYFLDVFSKGKTEAKDKSKLANEIIDLIKYVKDDIERGYYINSLADKLGVDRQFVLEKYNQSLEKKKETRLENAVVEQKNRITPEERLAGVAISFFDDLKSGIKDLREDILSDRIKEIIQVLKSKSSVEDRFSWEWLDSFGEKEKERLRRVVMEVERDYGDLDKDVVKGEFFLLQQRLVLARRESAKEDLEYQIKQAESSGDRDKVKEYIRRLQDLIINDK